MDLGWEQHFDRIVIPAWQSYLASEQELSDAINSGDKTRAEAARYKALREAGAATFYLHHFAEIVLVERAPFLPEEIKALADLQDWLGQVCTMMRTDEPANDVRLLGDVADALKHAALLRRLDERDVDSRDAVLVIDSGYGELGYGQGKFGGIDQVFILAKSGKRTLASVLQNVIDAWHIRMDRNLPKI